MRSFSRGLLLPGSRHLLSAQPDGPGLAQAQEVTGPVEQDSTARHAFGLLLALGIDTICTLQSILLQLYGSAPEIRCVPLLNDFVARFCPAPRGVLAGRREKRTSTAFFFSVFKNKQTRHTGDYRSAQLQEVASPSALKARNSSVCIFTPGIFLSAPLLHVAALPSENVIQGRLDAKQARRPLV